MTVEAFSELAKILPEPTILVTNEGEILKVNQPFSRMLATPQKDLIGKKLTEISFTQEEKIRKYLQNCSRSRQMIPGALDLRDSNEEHLEFRCEGAVIEQADGNGGAKIFLRLKPKKSADKKFTLLTKKIDELNLEVSERKRAEEASRKLYREATEANRLKDEFLATVSHELRTPLNAILGWARMLRMNYLDEAHFAKALETIERNARSQAMLVEDLLDVSRIITGKLRLDVRPVEIAPIVEAAIETIRPTAENKSIRLQVVIDPRNGFVSGDSERLQQIFWNLLSNAIRFTPKRGRVQVRLERVNSHIELIVSDTGVGIETEFLPYVFDRFRQADSSKTRNYGGLGLGLAITRHLVELHGGTVHVFSAGAGHGATFTIKLPVIIVRDIDRFPNEVGKRIHPTAFEESRLAENNLTLENLKLLVVEDDADAREIMKVLLKSYGAEVSVVSSAAAALEKFESSFFDILISDVEMPNEDGYSLIKKVRENNESYYGTIGAIALTAHARTSDRLNVLAAGFDAHVAKPFEPAELIAVIASLVRRSK